MIEQDKCIGCGICELVCTRGAISAPFFRVWSRPLGQGGGQ
ncbi:MAG: 4Fe-4S binding protein [Vulcanisaeta sp.]